VCVCVCVCPCAAQLLPSPRGAAVVTVPMPRVRGTARQKAQHIKRAQHVKRAQHIKRAQHVIRIKIPERHTSPTPEEETARRRRVASYCKLAMCTGFTLVLSVCVDQFYSTSPHIIPMHILSRIKTPHYLHCSSCIRMRQVVGHGRSRAHLLLDQLPRSALLRATQLRGRRLQLLERLTHLRQLPLCRKLGGPCLLELGLRTRVFFARARWGWVAKTSGGRRRSAWRCAAVAAAATAAIAGAGGAAQLHLI